MLCECGRGCQLVPSARQNWSVGEHLDRFNHKPCSAVVSGMFQLTQLSSHCGCILLTYPLVHTNISREWQNKLSVSPSVICNLAPWPSTPQLGNVIVFNQITRGNPLHALLASNPVSAFGLDHPSFLFGVYSPTTLNWYVCMGFPYILIKIETPLTNKFVLLTNG